MKHPLDGAIEQHRMVQLCYLAIKPEVNSRNRGCFELRKHRFQRLGGSGMRKHALKRIEWHGQDDVIELKLFSSAAQNNAILFWAEGID